jgi:hypothetical protein
MLIPKSRMMVITHALDLALASDGASFKPEEIALLHQIADKAAQCQMGDGNFLLLDVYYGNNPKVRM